MDQNTRDRRRSPAKVQTGLGSLLRITCILNFVSSASGSNCGNIITPKHLAFMEDLIGNQLQTSCNVTFSFVDLPNMHTDDQHKACYVLRAIPWVGRILKKQTESYTLTSTNFNHSSELKKLYDSLLSEQCLRRDERSTIDAKRCSRTYSMSPRDMLMMVKDVFIITKELLDKKPVECADPYDTCEDLDDEEEPEPITTTGPAQCSCSCPSPGPTGSLLMPVKPGSPQEHSRDPTGPDKPPIPEDEESIGRAHVYLVVPCIVGLLLALSGLFYYRHQNQILRRELQRTTFRREHQEERPLNMPEMVRLEME